MESKQRILVVDDEPQITLVLRSGLVKHGYDVRVAAEGESALVMPTHTAPSGHYNEELIREVGKIQVGFHAGGWSEAPRCISGCC